MEGIRYGRPSAGDQSGARYEGRVGIMSEKVRPSSYREAMEGLKSAQKGNYGAPAYIRWVNRAWGRRLAALASLTSLTPNMVSGISAAFTTLGCVLLVVLPIQFTTGLLVAVILAFGFALDSADGQLARLTGQGGPGGEWLDHTFDIAKQVMVHSSILLAWLRFEPEVAWYLALLPLAFVLVGVVAFFGWIHVEFLRRAAGTQPAPTQKGPVLRSLLRLPSDYGLQCWMFVLWGSALFLPFYALLFAVNALILLLALPVWFRQATAIGREDG